MSVICDRSVVFSGYSGFFHNKTYHHDITEILLKVALNTTTITLNMSHMILTTHGPVFLVISLLTRVYKSLLLLYINCWLLMSCYVIVLASTISMLFMIFKLLMLALNTNQSINLLFVVDHEIQYIYIILFHEERRYSSVV